MELVHRVLWQTDDPVLLTDARESLKISGEPRTLSEHAWNRFEACMAAGRAALLAVAQGLIISLTCSAKDIMIYSELSPCSCNDVP